MKSIGNPFTGTQLKQLQDFLHRMGLQYDEGIEYTVCLLDEQGNIQATGSLDHNVLKCIAVAPEAQGEGLTATVLSDLIQYAFDQGQTRLFLYTKPRNREYFGTLGFYEILCTDQVLFMENRQHGFASWLALLKEETIRQAPAALEPGKKIGAAVMTCNPFTNGHRYLIEQSLGLCDFLHVFLLSDSRFEFSPEERMDMLETGIQDLPGRERIILHTTQDYLISAATFPTYFFKDREEGQHADCELDLQIFWEKVAPLLHITLRTAGSEPFSELTADYNRQMQAILPQHGIDVQIIPRAACHDRAISATDVRKAFASGNLEGLQDLVPAAVCQKLEQLLKKKTD